MNLLGSTSLLFFLGGICMYFGVPCKFQTTSLAYSLFGGPPWLVNWGVVHPDIHFTGPRMGTKSHPNGRVHLGYTSMSAIKTWPRDDRWILWVFPKPNRCCACRRTSSRVSSRALRRQSLAGDEGSFIHKPHSLASFIIHKLQWVQSYEHVSSKLGAYNYNPNLDPT